MKSDRKTLSNTEQGGNRATQIETRYNQVPLNGCDSSVAETATKLAYQNDTRIKTQLRSTYGTVSICEVLQQSLISGLVAALPLDAFVEFFIRNNTCKPSRIVLLVVYRHEYLPADRRFSLTLHNRRMCDSQLGRVWLNVFKFTSISVCPLSLLKESVVLQYVAEITFGGSAVDCLAAWVVGVLSGSLVLWAGSRRRSESEALVSHLLSCRPCL